MKVSLYAICPNPKIMGSCRFYISLDLRVDLLYWKEQYDEGILYELMPKISLGTAIEICNSLNKLASDMAPRITGAAKPNLDLSTEAAQTTIQGWLEHLRQQTRILKLPEFFTVSPIRQKELHLNLEALNLLQQSLQGRSLLQEELMDLLAYLNVPELTKYWRSYVQLLYLQTKVHVSGGVVRHTKKQRLLSFASQQSIYKCQRCGSGNERMYWTYCSFCDQDCPYCEECLSLGKTRYCALLIQGLSTKRYAEGTNKGASQGTNKGASQDASQDISIIKEQLISRWKLSEPQLAAAVQGLEFLSETRIRSGRTKPLSQATTAPGLLIWAVTGAGKTEMTFPFIEAELAQGLQVVITTPRKDVVLELRPRLQQAFPQYEVSALYGGSSQRWGDGPLYIATTHQMIRFKHKFDLIIVDELDAFPFRFNPMLEFAVQNACTQGGRYILLSATPPEHLQTASKRRKLAHVKVPVRFHRHPLPVPKLCRFPALRTDSLRSIPAVLFREITESVQRDAQIFLFVPRIKLIAPLVSILRDHFRELSIDGTSSQDADRTEKVQAFRNKEIRLLVTTTILERGVTITNADVFVLNADEDIFDESTLVQMAGRSGRSQSNPVGKVRFFAKDRTRSQVKAIRQIQAMNRDAKRKGYLI